MHRTQIYINDREYSALRKEAFNKGRSISEIIRGLIDNTYLESRMKKASNLKNIVGLFKDKKSDVAKNHDKYLTEK